MTAVDPRTGQRMVLACAAMYIAAMSAGVAAGVSMGLREPRDLLLGLPVLGLSILLMVVSRSLGITQITRSTFPRRGMAAIALIAVATTAFASAIVPPFVERRDALLQANAQDALAFAKVSAAIQRSECPIAVLVLDTWTPTTWTGALSKKNLAMLLFTGIEIEPGVKIHRACLTSTELFARIDELEDIGAMAASRWARVPWMGHVVSEQAARISISEREWCYLSKPRQILCDSLPEAPVDYAAIVAGP